MAKAETRTVYDGQTYETGEEIWDLGSLRCVEVHGKQRYYQGHTQDKLKLPKYNDLATGSRAILIDPTGEESTIIARYDESTKQWLNLKGGVVV